MEPAKRNGRKTRNTGATGASEAGPSSSGDSESFEEAMQRKIQQQQMAEDKLLTDAGIEVEGMGAEEKMQILEVLRESLPVSTRDHELCTSEQTLAADTPDSPTGSPQNGQQQDTTPDHNTPDNNTPANSLDKNNDDDDVEEVMDNDDDDAGGSGGGGMPIVNQSQELCSMQYDSDSRDRGDGEEEEEGQVCDSTTTTTTTSTSARVQGAAAAVGGSGDVGDDDDDGDDDDSDVVTEPVSRWTERETRQTRRRKVHVGPGDDDSVSDSSEAMGAAASQSQNMNQTLLMRLTSRQKQQGETRFKELFRKSSFCSQSQTSVKSRGGSVQSSQDLFLESSDNEGSQPFDNFGSSEARPKTGGSQASDFAHTTQSTRSARSTRIAPESTQESTRIAKSREWSGINKSTQESIGLAESISIPSSPSPTPSSLMDWEGKENGGGRREMVVGLEDAETLPPEDYIIEEEEEEEGKVKREGDDGGGGERKDKEEEEEEIQSSPVYPMQTTQVSCSSPPPNARNNTEDLYLTPSRLPVVDPGDKRPLLHDNYFTWAPVPPESRLRRTYRETTSNGKEPPSDSKPYYCPDNMDVGEYSKVILHMMDSYLHMFNTVQRSLPNLLPWGKPIRPGPRHEGTLNCRKRTPPEPSLDPDDFTDNSDNFSMAPRQAASAPLTRRKLRNHLLADNDYDDAVEGDVDNGGEDDAGNWVKEKTKTEGRPRASRVRQTHREVRREETEERERATEEDRQHREARVKQRGTRQRQTENREGARQREAGGERETETRRRQREVKNNNAGDELSAYSQETQPWVDELPDLIVEGDEGDTDVPSMYYGQGSQQDNAAGKRSRRSPTPTDSQKSSSSLLNEQGDLYSTQLPRRKRAAGVERDPALFRVKRHRKSPAPREDMSAEGYEDNQGFVDAAGSVEREGFTANMGPAGTDSSANRKASEKKRISEERETSVIRISANKWGSSIDVDNSEKAPGRKRKQANSNKPDKVYVVETNKEEDSDDDFFQSRHKVQVQSKRAGFVNISSGLGVIRSTVQVQPMPQSQGRRVGVRTLPFVWQDNDDDDDDENEKRKSDDEKDTDRKGNSRKRDRRRMNRYPQYVRPAVSSSSELRDAGEDSGDSVQYLDPPFPPPPSAPAPPVPTHSQQRGHRQLREEDEEGEGGGRFRVLANRPQAQAKEEATVEGGSEEDLVMCPLCSKMFSIRVIEAHASDCSLMEGEAPAQQPALPPIALPSSSSSAPHNTKKLKRRPLPGHTEREDYVCEWCAGSFRGPGSLKRHRESCRQQTLMQDDPLPSTSGRAWLHSYKIPRVIQVSTNAPRLSAVVEDDAFETNEESSGSDSTKDPPFERDGNDRRQEQDDEKDNRQFTPRHSKRAGTSRELD